MKRTLAALALLLALPIHGAGYHVKRHIAIGGEGGWDALTVDETLRRLFVSHGTEVDVVNLANGKKVGTIDKLEGVHGIAIAQDLGRGYISNGRSGMVTVFELSTLHRIADWKATGDNPDAILYDRASRRVFTFNGRGQNATVFDAKTGEVVATIPLQGKPEFAEARGDGTVFVNLEDKSEVAEIDAKTANESPCRSAFDLAPEDGGLRAALHVEFGQQRRHVVMNGPFGDNESGGDLLVAQIGGEQLQPLVLTRGETERVPGSRPTRLHGSPVPRELRPSSCATPRSCSADGRRSSRRPR